MCIRDRLITSQILGSSKMSDTTFWKFKPLRTTWTAHSVYITPSLLPGRFRSLTGTDTKLIQNIRIRVLITKPKLLSLPSCFLEYFYSLQHLATTHVVSLNNPWTEYITRIDTINRYCLDDPSRSPDVILKFERGKVWRIMLDVRINFTTWY